MQWQHYYRPESVAEALACLAEGGGRARLVAGATDVAVRLRRNELDLETLVDITRIPGLDRIERCGDRIEIGAQVTHGQAAGSALLREIALVLAEACALCGSPQIRNVGTIVGNVVNAQPAADATTALLALDASAMVVSAEGERRVPISAICLGPGRSAVDPTREMVVRLEFPVPSAAAGSAYQRLAQRRSLTLPVVAVAAVVAADALKKRFSWVRLAVGPVAPVPWRAEAAEQVLAGAALDDAARIEEAAALAARDARPRTSLRGSAAYRREMVRVMVRRALIQAVERIGIDG